MTAVFAEELLSQTKTVLAILKSRHLLLTTAESCTGGLLAALITEVPGSSEVFERGFVTYSNSAKSELLHVAAELIERHGAVSDQVALAMAEGALANSRAHVAVSITGIAGPGGGTKQKPVGLVHLACVELGRTPILRRLTLGDQPRSAIREASIVEALQLLQLQAER